MTHKTDDKVVVLHDEPPPKKKPWDWRTTTINAQDLCDKKFPEVQFIVPGLVPEGVTLLASRPKLGKTWLLLQIGSAVASGVAVLVPQATDEQPLEGDVLYLNLEDGDRRAQRRMTKLFGARRETWPARMTLATKWRRFDQGGLDDIRAWCRSVTRPTLVMIDTLKRVRPPRKPNQSDYDADYEASEGLQALAHEFPGLAFIVAHHDRKMNAEDVFDTVSGTLGLTGGVDTIAILKRHAQGVTLHIEGRDLLEEVAKAVCFDRETCRWVVQGEAVEVHQADERKRVLDVLAASSDGLATSEIIAAARLVSRGAADMLLLRMLKDGQIERIKKGTYGLPGTRGRIVARMSEKVSEKSEKVRSDPKVLKDQEDKLQSHDLTHLTGGSGSEKLDGVHILPALGGPEPSGPAAEAPMATIDDIGPAATIASFIPWVARNQNS
jgi:AAA domain